jgi:murein DD-endopeptidase MepM/ murein hydrolase activator NlpD
VVASHNFGQRRILNGQPRSSHAGVDFASATGTLVRAAQCGRIALAENLFFSGGTVVIDHGLGLYTFYGHLSAILVKEGQRVQAGVPVGKVGATGRATGPHLHWSVRLNGARVNPLALVAALGPGAVGRTAGGPRR